MKWPIFKFQYQKNEKPKTYPAYRKYFYKTLIDYFFYCTNIHLNN